MAYLKDIKVCVNCAFYGTPHGHNSKCLHPSSTEFNLETGAEAYFYCLAVRQSDLPQLCGRDARYYVPNDEQAQRDKEFEEAMRDFPA